VVLAALFHGVIALDLFLVMLGVTGQLSLSGLWVLLIAAPLQIGLTAGLGFLAAAINVFFRDTAQINSMLLQGLFYLTPIVYPLSLVPDRFGKYVAINRLSSLVTLYLEGLLGGTLVVCSHAMYGIFAFCEQAQWLRDGGIEEFGPTRQVGFPLRGLSRRQERSQRRTARSCRGISVAPGKDSRRANESSKGFN